MGKIHSKISISHFAGIKRTDLNTIVYCKAEGNYTRIYTKNRNFVISQVLKTVESALPKDLFLRIHKSYLINLNYVTGIKQENIVVLEPNIELPIARRRKSKILVELSKYFITF